MKNKLYKSIALLAILIFIASILAFPAVHADLNTPYISTGKSDTYAFIGATPNPVGVNQQVLLHIGITQQLQLVQYGWEGLTVTVTKPDGTKQTLGPFNTDSTGGTGTVFVPTEVGNYTFQTHFPQQRMPTSVAGGGFSGYGVPANTTMLASNSDILTLTVQQEPINIFPGVPLPTEYWTRPINAQHREWYTISGSSWMSNDFNQAPETPHVLWTKPLTLGGLVGGEHGLLGSGGTSVAIENGDAYEGKWGQLLFGGGGPLILAGNLYYQDGSYDRPRLVHCVDLRTGEERWARTFLDNQSIAFGQLFYWQSYNYQGTFPYLWVTVGSTWTAFDAHTGEWRTTITNMPSGTRIMGPRGEIYLYTVNLNAGYMSLWNMSAFVSMMGSWGSQFSLREYNASSGTYRSYQSSGQLGNTVTSGAADRLARAYSWNISIPRGLTGSVRAINWTDGRVIGANVNATDVDLWAFAIPPMGKMSPATDPAAAGASGALLYKTNWKAPSAWQNQTITWATADLTYNIGIVWSKEYRQSYAFDLKTGLYKWITDPEQYLNIYGANRRIYNGMMYSSGYAGTVYAYDLNTGKTVWSYQAADPYQAEVLWSSNWPETLQFTSGGKIYVFHYEHSANQPLPRGAPAVCLNATDGSVIWRVNGLLRSTNWGGQPVLGDSVIAMYNTYDQQVYAVGKGPSATTVMAPLTAVAAGDSMIIQGKVIDISPGTRQTGLELRFPNGVPAVSDADQGEWMKYVYAQFPMPQTTGVTVSIDAVDPNGNFIHIGDATSDSSGLFSMDWGTPDVPGKYTILASFSGSGSYYGSYAETAAFVKEAPLTTATPTPSTQTSIADTYFLPVSAGLIVLMIIVMAMVLMTFKKRP